MVSRTLTAALLILPLQALALDYLVKLRPGLKAASLGVRTVKTLSLSHSEFALVRADDLARIEHHPAVEYIERDAEWTQGEVTKGPELSWDGAEDRFGLLWGLSNDGRNEPDRNGLPGIEEGRPGADINALSAWRLERGSNSLKVAVIDGGVDYTHPDLAGNMWTNPGEIAGNGKDDDGNGYIDDVHGWNALMNNGNPMDENGHGTHCAGTIGATHNDGGVSGVMGNVRIMAVKFLNGRGSGKTSDAIEGIDYAIKMGADIMSNSWGGGPYSRALYDTIKHASSKGILFVAAAGNQANDNDRNTYYPAGYRLPNIVAVAAHAFTDALANFSNRGNNTVHIAAPGKNILSTTVGGGHAVLSGTSMATPHVSGALGLLLAKAGRMSPALARERLMMTSIPAGIYRRHTISGGRLDALNLLRDTRPFRHSPDPTKWEKMVLETPYETDHPYGPLLRTAQTFKVPGARYVRVVVERFELERNYDFLTVKDAQGEVVDRVTGKGSTLTSEFAVGDTVVLEFSSDTLTNGWGVIVREIQFIR